MVITTSGALDLVGDEAARYEAGKGAGPTPTKWHVQLARDARFNDLVADAIVGLDVTKVEAKGLEPGTYHARVSAYDGDQFEGPYGEPLSLTVVSAKVLEATLPTADAPGKLAAVQFAGAPCGVGRGGAKGLADADAALARQGPRHPLRDSRRRDDGAEPPRDTGGTAAVDHARGVDLRRCAQADLVRARRDGGSGRRTRRHDDR
ncbi:MAG: hypothetical protein IPJ34_07875 [Myxococcales bacterium]|nr:hypothetical protein [Myxococcales bacterium]